MLGAALEQAGEEGAEVRSVCLSGSELVGCPDAGGGCQWPCMQSVVCEEDPMIPIYRDLMHWSDVLLVAGDVRANCLEQGFYRFLARLRAMNAPQESEGRLLVRNQVAALLPCGAWRPDGGPIAEALASLSALGFSLPPFPAAGYRTGCVIPGPEAIETLLWLRPEIEARARGLASRVLGLARRLRPASPTQPRQLQLS